MKHTSAEPGVRLLIYQSKKEKKEAKILIAATEASEVQQGIIVFFWIITIPQQPTHLVMQFKY